MCHSNKCNITMEENHTVRKDLANVFRGLAWYGMQEGIFNHCTALATARSGKGQVILMAPFGLLWQDVTPECLIGVDPATGELVEGEGEVLLAAKCMHMAVYKARPDAKAILHTHPKYAAALGCLRDNRLRMIHQMCLRFHDDVAYFDEFDVIQSDDEGLAIAEAYKGNKRVLMMSSHGIATVGSSVAIAFDLMHGFEIACKFQITAMSCGKELNELSDECARVVRTSYESTLDSDSQKHLDAVARHLDKV